MILVGNKKDLEDKREVSYEEGEEFAKNNGLLFFKASAKTGEIIDDLFRESVEDITKKIESDYSDTSNESYRIKIGEKKDMRSEIINLGMEMILKWIIYKRKNVVKILCYLVLCFYK